MLQLTEVKKIRPNELVKEDFQQSKNQAKMSNSQLDSFKTPLRPINQNLYNQKSSSTKTPDIQIRK